MTDSFGVFNDKENESVTFIYIPNFSNESSVSIRKAEELYYLEVRVAKYKINDFVFESNDKFNPEFYVYGKYLKNKFISDYVINYVRNSINFEINSEGSSSARAADFLLLFDSFGGCGIVTKITEETAFLFNLRANLHDYVIAKSDAEEKKIISKIESLISERERRQAAFKD